MKNRKTNKNIEIPEGGRQVIGGWGGGGDEEKEYFIKMWLR